MTAPHNPHTGLHSQHSVLPTLDEIIRMHDIEAAIEGSSIVATVRVSRPPRRQPSRRSWAVTPFEWRLVVLS